MNNLRPIWGDLRSSFWFVPLLMVTGSIVLAATLIEVESAENARWLTQWPRLFGAGAEGARQMLATLAGSMMSVMGITFSMTLLALVLASTQYTSRILRNFMRSRVTQGTLGVFAGIFVYCLIVLRTIRGGETDFVPSLAVFFAFILSLAGVVVLIYFIHHIALSIQASSIIASVAQETITSIDRLFPENPGCGAEEDECTDQDRVLRSLDERTWYSVPANVSGYIQSVDYGALLHLARGGKTMLKMEHGVGSFFVQDTALVSLALTFPPDQKMISALNGAYSIGRHRTIEDDPAFGIRRIVDMALKALSPGVNDTSTAVMSVDYLTSILARLACQPFPLSHRYEEETLRVIAIVTTFEGLLAEAFDQIRGSAAGNVAVIARMLGAVHTIGSMTTNPHRRQALYQQFQSIAELADRTIEATHDRARIQQRLAEVREKLHVSPGMNNQVAKVS